MCNCGVHLKRIKKKDENGEFERKKMMRMNNDEHGNKGQRRKYLLERVMANLT